MAFSQEVDSAKFTNRKSSIFLNTSSLVIGDIWNVNIKWITMGYERDFAKKLSINFSAGFAFHFPENKNSMTSIPFVKKSKGFDLSPEIKKYVKNNIYIGAQLYFQHTLTSRTQDVLDYITYIPIETYHYKTINYSVNRTAIAVHVKLGKKYTFKNGILIDNSIGLGVRYINSYSTGKKEFQSTSYEIPYNKPFDNGNAFFPSFVYHLKVGYSFKK